MARTPEETARRAKIAARAQELMATGMSMGAAAQQAYSESQKEFAREGLALESEAAAQSIDATREKYATQRADVLQKEGVAEPIARATAEKEFESAYLKPVTGGYGELEDLQPGGLFKELIPTLPKILPKSVTGIEPSLSEALKPQTFIPQSAVDTEAQRMERPAKVGIIGTGPDYETLRNNLFKSGLSAREAEQQVLAFKAAYEAKLLDYPEKTEGVAKKAWDATIEEVSGIPDALSDKTKYTKEKLPGGPADPLYLAFSKQVKAGEGVPTLTRAQGQYIASIARQERKDKEDELRAKYGEGPIEVTETERVEGVRGGAPRTVVRKLSGSAKDAEIARQAAEQVEVPWWSDPEEVKKRLKSGTYTKPGVFTTETPFGTQRETSVGYLTRAAMAPLNAIAGAVFPYVFTGFGEDKEYFEQKRREARPELYKDNPVLLNIAEGRGFVGEAAELSRITGMDTEKLFDVIPAGTLYTAGAFAADLLDPSLDLLAGGIRGAKAAGQAAKVAKELGAATADVARAAKQAGLKATVSSGDVRIAVSDVLASRTSNELVTPAGRVAAAPGAPEIVKTVDDKLNKLDALVDDATDTLRLPKEEFIRALGDAARIDPTVANAIRAAESGPRAGIGSRQIDVVRTNPTVRAAVQEALIRSTVRTEVFKATSNTVLQNGLVAVTSKTFATAPEARKIMKEVAKTDFMKSKLPLVIKNPVVGTRQVAATLPGRSRPSAVVDGYKLDTNSYNAVNEQLRSMVSRGRLTQQSFNKIYGALRNNPEFISATDLRTIIDAGVDDVASSYKTVSGRDIAETSPLVARELTEPLQTKDFTSPVFRNWLSGATKGKSVGVTEALTPIQRKIFDDVSGKLGKLDAKLRFDMNRMMTSEDVRKLYGIAPGANLGREGLVGHLIVGPVGKKDVTRIERTLKLAVDRLIYGKQIKQDIFDVFDGIKVDELSDVWSTKGRKELDKLVKTAAAEVEADPSKYMVVLAKLNDDATALARTAENLKIPAKEVVINKGKLSEQAIASYYAAEANRLLNESYTSIITSEGGFINQAFANNLQSKTKQALATVSDASPLQAWGEIIGKYINALAENPRFREGSIEDISKAIGISEPVLFRNGVVNTEYAADLARLIDARPEIIAEVDAVATRVMKNNGLKPSKDVVGDLMKIVNKAAEKGGPLEANMQAILGPNVASQLQNALSAGGAANIEKGLASALRGDERNIAIKAWDTLTSLWYTLVLTAAPRFHGANIVGAPEVIFTTTGKLISPLPIPGTSTFDAAMVMKRAGGPKGAATAVTDPAGRTYSNNEIYNALMEGGGETVAKADVPSSDARRALIQLQSGPAGAARRAIDAVLESPQNEDILYRMAVAIEELKAGRPMESAVRLARSALMDKGTITEAEKPLQRAIMFYSFTRNNFVNLMKNLMTPEGWSRVARALKTKRGIESFNGLSEEEKAYLPESAAVRTVLARGADVGEKGNVIALPGSSTLSAVELLTKFLAFDQEYFIEQITGRAPTLIKGAAETEVERIPPEHVFIFDSIARVTDSDVEDIMSVLAGEPVVPFKSNEPGNVNGLVYPLTSPNARKRYSRTLGALKFIGLERLINDIPNSVRAPGGKVETAIRGNNLGVGTAAFAAGFISPLKTQMAEKQRLKTLLAQNAEGRKLVKDIEDILVEDIVQPISPDVAVADERRTAVKEKAQFLRESDDIETQIRKKEAELNSLVVRMRSATSEAAAMQLMEIGMKKEQELLKLYERQAQEAKAKKEAKK